jgi:bacillithiol biosynthesis deacetylase BshB1
MPRFNTFSDYPMLLHGTAEPVDVLAFAAHPDDVELCAGGTVCRLVRDGYRVAVVDLTQGQLGSRGTSQRRLEESRAAARVMGLHARENLGMMDGALENTPDARLPLIRALRTYRPRIVLLNAPDCRHPDHGAAAQMAGDALFYAGLRTIETAGSDGQPQEPHRPSHALHYMQSIPFTPTVVVDVSDVWEQRMEALYAFSSQFHRPGADDQADEEPVTFISNPAFHAFVESQARAYGYRVGATYGEPLLYRHGPIGVDDLGAFLGKEKPFR